MRVRTYVQVKLQCNNLQRGLMDCNSQWIAVLWNPGTLRL